jgi:chemotaxis protein CheX
MGDGHTIAHMSSIKPIAIPFTTQAGSFTVEFCLED